MVFGNLYVQGGIDPTYLALTPQGSNPLPAGLDGIWIETGGSFRVQETRLDDFSGTTPGYVNIDPISNPQITLSDGVTPTEINVVTLNNNRILLNDYSGTGTTTSFTTTTLSQTTSGPTTISATWSDIINGAASLNTLQQVLTAGNTADNSIELTDGTQINQLQKTSIAITNPISNGSSSFSANGLNITTDDPGLSSGGVGVSTTSTSAQISGGVAGLPSPPYPAPDANFSIYANTSNFNPTLYLSKSAPFTNSTSLTLDLNNLIHNQSTGSPSPNDDFTISTNKNLIMTADNIDLSSTGRLIVPTLTGGDYLDYNPSTNNLSINTNNTGTPSNPLLTLSNTDTATGSATMRFYKNLSVVGNAIGELTFNANTTTATNQEYARISSTIRSNTSGNLDGSISLNARVNNSNVEFIRVNGVDSQTEFLQPIDMNGNAINTGAGDLTLDATTSSIGTGNINLTPKTGAVVNVAGNATLTGTRKIDFGDGTNIINTINRTGLLITNNSNPADITQSVYQDANCNLTELVSTSQYFNTNVPTSHTIRLLESSSEIQKNQSTLSQTRLNFIDTATNDQSSIRLENDLASLNNVIGTNYTTGAGATLETIIQTIPSSHRLTMTNNNTLFSCELSTERLFLNDTTNNKSTTLDNDSNTNENRIDLFKNAGGGIYSQSGIVNNISSQTLYLNYQDNANGRSLNLSNDSASGGVLNYTNQISPAQPFTIESSTGDLILKTNATNALTLDSDILNLANTNTTTSVSNHNADIKATSAGLESTTFLKLQLNGVDIWVPYFTTDPSI